MVSWWEHFQDELKPIICEWCHKGEDVYDLDSQLICRDCLIENEYEEQPSLFEINEERNK